MTRHPKYKTEQCRTYHQTGYCPYGMNSKRKHKTAAISLKHPAQRPLSLSLSICLSPCLSCYHAVSGCVHWWHKKAGEKKKNLQSPL